MPEQFGSGQVVTGIVPLRTEIIVVDAECRSGDSDTVITQPWPPRLSFAAARRSVNNILPSSY
jgi:hypothetical protein